MAILRIRSGRTGATARLEKPDGAVAAGELAEFCLKKGLISTTDCLVCGSDPKQLVPVPPSVAFRYRQVFMNRHGDVIFVDSANREDKKPAVDEQRVDRILSSMQDIGIKRAAPQCRHSSGAACEHCLHQDPWDPAYLAAKGIKHLSFHSFLRRHSVKDKSIALDPGEYRYEVQKSCSFHAPYPKGICSKCAPSAITLRLQEFRHVDHVEFVSAATVDGPLVSEWRRTGRQVFAWLWGRYEPYDGVPLGIKAVVEALEVPPQKSLPDGFVLGETTKDYDEAVNRVAASLGLQRVRPRLIV